MQQRTVGPSLRRFLTIPMTTEMLNAVKRRARRLGSNQTNYGRMQLLSHAHYDPDVDSELPKELGITGKRRWLTIPMTSAMIDAVDREAKRKGADRTAWSRMYVLGDTEYDPDLDPEAARMLESQLLGRGRQKRR